MPWGREKLLRDERKLCRECRLARGGAGLRWEGGQSVGNVLGRAPWQRAEPPLPPGSENLRSLLLDSYWTYPTRSLDHKQQLTHFVFEAAESCWSPHRCCCRLGSFYGRGEAEQPEQGKGGRRTCGSRSKPEGEMETSGGLRTRQGKLACGDPAPNRCVWERRIRHPPTAGLCSGSRTAAKKGPHGLGMGLEVGLVWYYWPRDHILQLRTVFTLVVGNKQYLN